MLQTKTELDFELCRKLMLRQEELYDSRTPSLITHFRFEEYSIHNDRPNDTITQMLKMAQNMVGKRLRYVDLIAGGPAYPPIDDIRF